jgi:hypothetical protein
MIFSCGGGSAGAGAPSYSAWLPFTVSPGRTLNLGGGGRFELLGHACEIVQGPNQYVLNISSFDSEDDASTFLQKACAGLIWFGLKSLAGFQFDPDPSPVELFSQPRPIADASPLGSIANKKGWRDYDGHYDADKTVIRPDHKRLLVYAVGSITPRLDTPVSLLSKVMLEGMAEGRPELVLRDPRLRLACEVYLSSHFENTPAASFLSRITTLEILVKDAPASAAVQKTVNRFIEEVTASQEKEESADVRREFESLLSRLVHLRNRSIRSGIRQLVEQQLQMDPEIAEPAKISKEVSGLYDLRSNLVHTGEVDPEAVATGNSRLNDVVARILRALFKETAQRA